MPKESTGAARRAALARRPFHKFDAFNVRIHKDPAFNQRSDLLADFFEFFGSGNRDFLASLDDNGFKVFGAHDRTKSAAAAGVVITHGNGKFDLVFTCRADAYCA